MKTYNIYHISLGKTLLVEKSQQRLHHKDSNICFRQLLQVHPKRENYICQAFSNHNEMIFSQPSGIVFNYSEFHKAYERLAYIVTFKNGLPTEEQLKPYKGKLVIIDD